MLSRKLRVLPLFGFLALCGCHQTDSNDEEMLHLNFNITWNNSQTGTNSSALQVQVLDTQGSPVANETKQEAAGVTDPMPVTTTDQVGFSYPVSTGATYLVTMQSCTVADGTGPVPTSGTPTVDIHCN